MKILKALSVSVALLSGLHSAAFAADAKDDPVIATVNGKALTHEMLEVYTEQRMRNQNSPPLKDQEAAIKELINIELVLQDAEKQGIDKRPNVAKQLDWQRRSLLVGLGMREHVAAHPVTDEEVKKAYEERIANHDGKEYHARHILVATEDEAKAVLKEASKKDADFGKLAEAKSTGPTGNQGGDLGWFSADQMVKPFAEAVAKMKKGEISKKPVQTQFGWHVIKLEDTRDVPAPALETLEEQLRMHLTNQRVEQYIEDLRKAAKIDIKK